MNDRLLSILCVFRNQKEDAETTLTTLYERLTVPFELVVIDDASDDGTTDAIESVVRHFAHDSTFYFANPEPRGMAVCLNDALNNAGCPVGWAPGVLSSIDPDAAQAAVAQLMRAQAPFMVCGGEVPIRPDRWVEAIVDSTLPPDSAFLFRKEAVQPVQRFLNPFLNRAFLPEWIIRTDTAGLVLSQPNPICDATVPYLSDADKNELLLSLVRCGRWKLGDIADYYKTVRTTSTVKLGNEISTLERLVRDGEIQAALEKVDALLAFDPDRKDALLLKVKILEKLRKYVEAAELKRKLRDGNGSDAPPVVRKTPILVVDPSEDPGDVVEPDITRPEPESETDPEPAPPLSKRADATPDTPIRISIIIPTTSDRRAWLESCLTGIRDHAGGPYREVVVVDNGCIDDTPEFLDDAAASGFLNLKVIHNQRNLGFAAAVNQGIASASGQILVVMHNDVTLQDDAIGTLASVLESNPDVAVVGAMTGTTHNRVQEASSAGESGLVEVGYVDSVCFAFRKDDGLRMDESFGMAWFDDIDFCRTAAGDGRRIVLERSAWVGHAGGTTTQDLGVAIQSVAYWQNAASFHRKWAYKTLPEPDPLFTEPIDILLGIGSSINPLFPETPYLRRIEPLFVSEIRHEIAIGTWNQAEIDSLLRLLMATNQRDLLRTTEEKLDIATADRATIELLIEYYYRLRIFSRCRMYVEKMPEERRSFAMYLTLVAIAVEEKEMEQAAELATFLNGYYPVNPWLLRLSADIHAHYRNTDEAKAFRELAFKLDPREA